MESAAEVLAPKEMEETGKILVYGDYLIINEVRKGVHIIDNSNPANPNPVAFIALEGNIDIAAKGNLLFLDSYFSLFTFDLSDPTNPKYLNKSNDVFPISKYRFDNVNQAYIVGQLEEEVTEEVECSSSKGRGGWLMSADFDNVRGGGSSGPIVAGSMASMVIVNGNLYIINGRDVLIFSTEDIPANLGSFTVAFGIETLFPHEDKLFIGGQNGMYIFDNSDPMNPVRLSSFRHMTSCDPVFVKGDVAYVTLRDGTPCNGATNQLDVIDISDILNPVLLKTYPMYNPHGLSVDEEQLYLCDGSEGLKVFGIDNLLKITDNKKNEFGGMTAYDVIRMPNKELLIVIAKEGLYQFELGGDMHLISKLSTKS